MSRITTWKPGTGRGVWSLLGPDCAEALSLAKTGWIGLDAQHGFYDDLGVRRALHVIGPDNDVMVRVPRNDPAWIGRVLDAGARGVIVPMVENRSHAAAAAAASRFPATGQRSWGQFAEHWGRAEQSPTGANDAVVCAVMIETAEGLERADEIAAVTGVDMIYLGPFDLSLALGTSVDRLLDGADRELESIVRVCHENDVIPGAYAGNPVRAERLCELGFEVVAVTTDRELLTDGAAALRDKPFVRPSAPAQPVGR